MRAPATTTIRATSTPNCGRWNRRAADVCRRRYLALRDHRDDRRRTPCRPSAPAPFGSGHRIPCPDSPGDSITSTAKIASIETHQSGESMVLELEARNVRGETVNRTIFTSFIRGRRAGSIIAEGKADDVAFAARRLLTSRKPSTSIRLRVMPLPRATSIRFMSMRMSRRWRACPESSCMGSARWPSPRR